MKINQKILSIVVIGCSLITLLEDRNSTSHIYNENLEDEVAKRIMNDYVAAIGELVKNLEGLL
ncbi:nucleotidyltransferase substrate binding protein [Clostridium gasigenes]|uniref:nucleotidyltransferase substrate binding protein n=1 Tax=Clostridium gasigenes TaxID=94869 RepID=UPI0014385E8B|nr:nucleotidyltransferase substrate binding protein [Clostridium gasigenes]NKF08659.1 hypothetical protein [Clostridium gasigenes]QSW21238.1 nucleotidyltransferase substrate binding protein [Clostridium gasigenes]